VEKLKLDNSACRLCISSHHSFFKQKTITIEGRGKKKRERLQKITKRVLLYTQGKKKKKQKQNKKKNAQPCRLLFGAFQSMKEQYKKIPPSPSTK